MRKRGRRNRREGATGGLLLVVLGLVFLLHQLEIIHVGRVWQWWPYLAIGAGLFQMALWSSAESVSSGFGLALFGGWFLITVNGWWGLDWSRSWPLALVAIGLSMVSRSLLEPLFRVPPDDASPEGGLRA